MTVPQPATPGSDSVRAQIAEALAEHMGGLMWSSVDAQLLADVLVPLVDRLRAEAKAEALDEARGILRDRAAAYRTNPSSEETNRGR